MNAITEPTAPDRTKFIGGSDVAAILGVSPWRNIVDLWMDKIKPRGDTGNVQAKRRGQRLEPYILDMIREEFGLDIVAHNQRYIDEEFPFLACEIDFEYIDSDTGKIENGEIKTVHPFKAKEWGAELSDDLPLPYIAQAQHNLGIKGRRRCKVFALIGDDLKPYTIERDDELIAAMREKSVEFWNRYVIPQIMPPIDYQHKDVIDTLKRLYPGTDGTTIPANAMHEHWRALYQTAQQMVGKYEALLDGAKAHLLAEMGNAAAITFDDGMCFARKVIKKKGYTVSFPASQYVDFRLAKLKE
jgi:putative phage-type endonuclease